MCSMTSCVLLSNHSAATCALSLCANYEPESHVLTEPLHVVGPPSIVEEAAMNARREVRLRARKAQRRHLAERDQRRVEQFDGELVLLLAVAEPALDGVHLAVTGRNDIEWGDILAAFVDHPALLRDRDRTEREP